VLQRRPNTFAQTILSFSFFACDEAADHTFQFAHSGTIPRSAANRLARLKASSSVCVVAVGRDFGSDLKPLTHGSKGSTVFSHPLPSCFGVKQQTQKKIL